MSNLEKTIDSHHSDLGKQYLVLAQPAAISEPWSIRRAIELLDEAIASRADAGANPRAESLVYVQRVSAMLKPSIGDHR
ncbi:hypothetical protein [Kribbella sp. NPDC050470]|uniref:hypothetical protein n=1 Tax=unclassified Kribbella TaxID=2644121 RepID=UPI0037AE5261